MFKNIVEYMNLSQSDRQKHIDLNEKCIEIGTSSGHCKALLAHYLKTTIPQRKDWHLCHKCHNGGCSNPKHLYWGTSSENTRDTFTTDKPFRPIFGPKGTKNRLGEEKYNQLKRENGKLSGQTRKQNNDKKWAPFKEQVLNAQIDFSSFGWVNHVSVLLNISPQKVNSWMKRNLPEFYETCYKRKSCVG